MSAEPLETLEPLIDAACGAAGRDALGSMRAAAAAKGFAWLEVHLASLPRKLGRHYLDGDVIAVAGGRLDLRAYRRCDLAAADLLLRSGASATDRLTDLYFQGDAEERRMILAALPWLPTTDTTVRLLQEAHRTNDEAIFKAAFADHDLPARVLSDDDFNRGVLKAAFVDLDLARLLGAPGRANEALSDMLLQFMTEREAAGRPTWAGSLELAAHAPVSGVRARVLGDLWHGRDARRLAAARAAATLGGDAVLAEVRARIDRERVSEIRQALSAVLEI